MIHSIISSKASCPFAANISSELETNSHFHSELELVFLLNGTMTYILGGSQFHLNAKDFIFANPYTLHSVSFVSDDCYYVHFLIEESRLRYLFSTTESLVFDWNESMNNREKPLYREVADAVQNIVLESNNQENRFLARSFQEVMRILVALDTWCKRPAVSQRTGIKTQNQQQKSAEIMDYLNNHYMEEVTLNTLSKALYLSPTYISKIFKGTFQVGFLEYLNRLRIQKSIYPLCHSNAYIADIAESCGFTNAKTYGRAFQKEMGISPTDYRKQYSVKEDTKRPLFNASKDDILPFLLLNSTGDAFSPDTVYANSVSIQYDFTKPGYSIPFSPWNEVLYIGKADMLLNSSCQKAVLRAVDDFDVKSIRFSGVLSDDLNIYQEDDQGNSHYYWVNLDEILHFITHHKLKPFLSLGFMPKQLAMEDSPSPYYWGANTSRPKDKQKWSNYIQAFLRHLVKLYSYKTVCSWRFDFWEDPAIPGIFWQSSEQAFRDFFMVTYRAFRSVLPDAPFGTPGFVAINHFKDTERFLTFCKSQDVRFDFLCMHLFEQTDPKNPGVGYLHGLETLSHFRNRGSRFIEEAVNTFHEMACKVGYSLPIVITEWNVSPYFHDLSRDTCFMGTYIFDTLNRLPECVSSITFWSLTDDTGEHKPIQDMFSGELGMRTINDVAKPSYLAFQMLKRLQGSVLMKGDGYCVTRSEYGYHVALYNYTFYNEAFLDGTNRPLSREDRYQIFEQGHPKHFQLDLTLESGRYRIERYILDREHGSIYDGWVRMGAPETIDRMCLGYLDKMAYPGLSIQYKNIKEKLVFSEQVPQHGIVLLNLIYLGEN